MTTIIGIILIYLGTVCSVLAAMRLLSEWNGRRYRRWVVERRPGDAEALAGDWQAVGDDMRRVLGTAEYPKIQTLFRANPAGPAQDALRAVKLRAYLDKSEPRA